MLLFSRLLAVSSPTSFEPTSAIIVKNKDELAIPLSLTDIPSPGEFRDAIASLSPEQQRFAKAFRAMQVGLPYGEEGWRALWGPSTS